MQVIKYTVQDNAPSTFEQLMRQRSVSDRLIVWAGASEGTIWGAPQMNWLFRAIHDSLHIKLGADFTLQGETLVSMEQARLVRNDALGDIVMAEVVGQAHYYAEHGEFPTNQLSFIQSYLLSKRA